MTVATREKRFKGTGGMVISGEGADLKKHGHMTFRRFITSHCK